MTTRSRPRRAASTRRIVWRGPRQLADATVEPAHEPAPEAVFDRVSGPFHGPVYLYDEEL